VNEATNIWCMEPYAPDAPLTLEEFLARPDWHAYAACRVQRTADWVSAEAPTMAQTALCSGCPVRRECLEYALVDPTLLGCWGGAVEKERREMRRARRKDAAA
jgi:WhiB family redox-sensing transcriptional regulator